jgi:hypothetical protein
MSSTPALVLSAAIWVRLSQPPLTYLKKSSPGFTEASMDRLS